MRSSDSANSSSDDMDHQKYTHVIHPARPMFVGLPDDPALANTNGHWRTSTDTKGGNSCDKEHMTTARPDYWDTARKEN